MQNNSAGDWNSLWNLLDDPISVCFIFGGLLMVCGLLFSVCSLFYLIFFYYFPYESLETQHSNRSAISSHLQLLESECNALANAETTDFIIKCCTFDSPFRLHLSPSYKLRKRIDKFTSDFSEIDTLEEDVSYLNIFLPSEIEYAIKMMTDSPSSKKKNTSRKSQTDPKENSPQKSTPSVTQKKSEASKIDELFAERLYDVERYTAENGFPANPKELYQRWKNRLASLSEDEKALVWEVLENYYGDIFEFSELIEEDGGKNWKGILQYIAPRLKNQNRN